MSLNVKPLTREIHDKFKGSFNCGNLRLSEFFNSSESLDAGVGISYVFLSDDETDLIGYYNITTGMIIDADNPQNRIGGSVHINCFALDNRYHGLLHEVDDKGNTIKLSDIFFHQCLKFIELLRTRIGFTFITLSSTQEGYNMYSRALFDELEDDMLIAEKEMEQGGCKPMYYALDVECSLF